MAQITFKVRQFKARKASLAFNKKRQVIIFPTQKWRGLKVSCATKFKS